MWALSSQTLVTKYHVPLLSRGFLLSSFCYLLAFILPALILVSIQYSISQYKKQLIKPTFKFHNHQITCLISDESSVYDSSFLNDQGHTYRTSVSAGADSNVYSIKANIVGNVLSCSILTYNKVIVNVHKYVYWLSQDNTQILVVLPFSFKHSSSSTTVFAETIEQKGKLELLYNSALLESSIKFNQSDYHAYDSDFSMVSSSQLYSKMNNFTGVAEVNYQKETYGTSGMTTFEGKFQIQSSIQVKSQSLREKIRQFVPFYIYLWIPAFYFLVCPLIEWMFRNKVYGSKKEEFKVKMD